MLSNKVIFNEVIDNILNSLTIRQVPEGVLTAEGETILVNKQWLTYIPHDINNEEIHGNRRSNLAKEFIKEYTFKDLKEKYNNKLQEQQIKAKYQEDNKERLEKLYNTLCELLIDIKEVRKSFIINHALNVYEIEFIVSKNDYSSYHLTVFMNYNSNDYNVYSEDTRKNMLESEIIEEVENMIPILINQQNRKEEENEKRRLEKNKRYNIQVLVDKLYLDDSIAILKKGKKFMAFEDSTRYSIGDNVRGKFYRCNKSTYTEYIDKGYTSYIQVESTRELTTEKLLSMNWKEIK